ncbi:MAG: 23S rRNA (adenine(2503)-C(2))-methyltransferase RlmN, partial [Peptostreptococcus sp.]|nr:23S rRNA (adenine(2503)-C(2))-methyltransferase RlmN [Peptostreptococcus sp.]
KLVNEKNGLNIGNRHITLSTCGLVDRILELADMQIPINLAISLHSPYDEERKEIMPIAKKYTIKELMDACRYYISKTNRRVTFEYALIKDKNNTDREAKKLVELLRGMLCHVNLIPINPIAERDYEKPNIEYINKFKNYLDKNKIPVSIRNSMGSDISGACGQLRRDYKETSKEE